MTVPARTKTWIVLGIGAVVLLVVLAPFHFASQGPLGIELLSIGAREQLVRRYEKPAQLFPARADSLRKAITARYGGTTPRQDSSFRVMESRVKMIQQVVDHLRHPERATFEEKSEDIARLLARLMGEAESTRRDLIESYLQ